MARTATGRAGTGEGDYSLRWRRPEADIRPTLEELGVGFFAYAPLGKGFLSGAIDVSTSALHQ